MIVTTYFANLRYLPEGYVPISICGKAPKGYTGLQYKKLAPKREFFLEWKKNHNNDYYLKCFDEQVLAHLNQDDVVKELQELAGSNKIALVCYEKPGKFCHRHRVAKWLSQGGYYVCELQ